MRMMPSMEGMDMGMETPNCVLSIHALLVLNLVQWEEEEVVEEEEEEEQEMEKGEEVEQEQEEHLGEGLDPQLEDPNSAS